jgi:hypothetical protein
MVVAVPVDDDFDEEDCAFWIAVFVCAVDNGSHPPLYLCRRNF